MDDAKNIVLLFMDSDRLIQSRNIGKIFSYGVLHQEGMDRIADEIINFSNSTKYKKLKKITEVPAKDGHKVLEVHMYC